MENMELVKRAPDKVRILFFSSDEDKDKSVSLMFQVTTDTDSVCL